MFIPRKFFCILIICFSFSLSCQFTKQKKQSAEADSSGVTAKEIGCPIPLSQGTVYGTDLSKFDQTYLLSVIKVLLGDLCAGSFAHLPSLIHPEKGLYVDAKGYWTYSEVEKDLADPKGYFQVYYFDSKKLDQKKGSVGNLTVRDVFLSAKEVAADFYVGSSEEVEVRFRFAENPKLERYLINPSFVKWEGKWYLLRMF
ncbi:putative lipoprotein [Leptospira wolbachii serovar Codice str. CDC]|uniref:Lipoprotein n=1 Tax=Leptospira wolbachii serovar Codice str. CDC TaxID=1218599 RepID=R9A3V6_9LEPT|nr:hypothetical protein [Leptospira wolbachii]EOQ96908.1 putative lipoprotein [Leptospira wolbachii serovar Codice str. CDC]